MVRNPRQSINKYWEHPDVKFEYKASIQNKENTGHHTEISCIKEEVEVDIKSGQKIKTKSHRQKVWTKSQTKSQDKKSQTKSQDKKSQTKSEDS
jgi:trehalose/maltose hydrolase-like predicted phosphorylase